MRRSDIDAGTGSSRRLSLIADILATLLVSLAALLLMLPAPARAQQDARIEGVVLDAETREPLPAANVFLRDLGRGTFSDLEGSFRIPDLPPVEDVLVASFMGYRSWEREIRLRAGEVERVEILLQPQTLEMGDITVTASRRAESEFRTTKAVTVSGEETITRRPAGSTADALREEPGVLVQKTTAGHGTPIIRGHIGKDILLLYNGVRLNKPTFRPGGNQYMDTIDAETLSRIEVVRGPGSVLYGSDAIGGMVNMITRAPAFREDAGWTPRLRTRYTSSDNGRALHAGIERYGPSFSARLGVTLREVGNLDPGGAIPVHDPTGYGEASGHAIMAWKLGENRTLRMDLLSVEQSEVPRYDQYASGSHEKYLYEPQRRFLGMAVYEHRRPLPWLDNLEFNVSWQQEHEGRIQRRTGSDQLRTDDDMLTTYGTFLQATSVIARRHALRWGVEFYHDLVESSRLITEPDTTYSTRGAYPDGSEFNQIGAFLSDDITLTSATDLTVGLRESRVWYSAPLEAPFGYTESAFDNLTGNIGVSHRLRPWMNIIGSLSRGFRAPNFNDTVVLKATNSGVDAPNPDLDPELSTNYEVGMKFEWDRNDIEAFAYYTDLSQLIVERPGTYQGLSFLDEDGDGVQDPGEPPIQQKFNAARAFIRGAEIQGRWHFLPAWRVRWNAFWTYGQNLTDDEPMRRIPPLMGLAGIAWEHGETTLELFVRAADEQRRLSSGDIDDSRIDPGGTPGWSDWNLRGRRDLGPVRLDVTLGNIFDHAYKEHGSGVFNPGRYVVLALTWDGPGF